jgi:hypothetical protein
MMILSMQLSHFLELEINREVVMSTNTESLCRCLAIAGAQGE